MLAIPVRYGGGEMDADIQALLRELEAEAPELAASIRRILEGRYDPQETWALIRALMVSANFKNIGSLFSRLIKALARAGRLPPPPPAAAGEPVASAGVGAGTAAAFVFMVVAIAVMVYRWWWAEHPLPLDLGLTGPPCGSTPEARAMESHDREVVAESYLGSADSLNDAIKAARKDCASINVNCGGPCAGGLVCRPALSLQDIQQTSTFPYIKTYTTLTYRCVCECVDALAPP